MDDVFFGNTFDKSPGERGWFIGNFVSKDDVRFSEDVELCWVTLEAGQKRHETKARDDCTTVSILISGNFSITVEDKKFDLTREGDYLLWKPGLIHTWEANDKSVILTVRWPSLSK